MLERCYAFIGARELKRVPSAGLQLYEQAAHVCGARDYLVNTGVAPGSDQRAAERCLEAGGRCAFYLPWRSYEQTWVQLMLKRYPGRCYVADCDPLMQPLAVMAIDLHPNAAYLKNSVRALMARNYLIVSGTNAVFALPRPPCQGGTAHGVKCAESLGIPVYNLSLADGRSRFQAALDARASAVR